MTNHWATGRTCNRWAMAMVPALGLALVGGGLAFLLWEPIYEASAWFEIEEHPPYLVLVSKDEGRSKLFCQAQIEMIRSPSVLGPVIKRPEIARQPEVACQPDKVAWLGQRIKVLPVGESELFRIVYAARDPKDAATVVNAVTESYFKLRDQSDTERNQRIIERLSQEREKRSGEVMRLRDSLRKLAYEQQRKQVQQGSREAMELLRRADPCGEGVRLDCAAAVAASDGVRCRRGLR